MAQENWVEALIEGSKEIDRMRERISKVRSILDGALNQVLNPKKIDIPLEAIGGQKAQLLIEVHPRIKRNEVEFILLVGRDILKDGPLPAPYVPDVYRQLETILRHVIHEGEEAATILQYLIATGERKLSEPTVTEL